MYNKQTNTIIYKGYYNKVTYDKEDRVFRGKLVNINLIKFFRAGSLERMTKYFHDWVDLQKDENK